MAPVIDKRDKAITDLQTALNESITKLKEQDKVLKEMSELPGMLARVTHILPKDADGIKLVLNDSLLVLKPSNIKTIEEGDYIHVSKSPTGGVAIIGVVPIPLQPVMTMKVAEIHPTPSGTPRIFIDLGQGNLVPVRKCPFPVEVGDRLLLGGDGPTRAVALENLGKETKHFQFTEDLSLSWSDIGGHAIAKQQMREAIEYPIIHADLFKSMGKKPIKGILLEGPPGCGKTLLAKAAASALSSIHGKTATSTGYIYVKGPEVLSKWVGEAESTIRSLFAMAREHHARHGYPAIIFLDECEALLSRRGSGVSSDMEKTIVPTFLAELDGLSTSGAMCILATNRPERLDPAVVRDGRIDRRIAITRPSELDAAEIFAIHLRRLPNLKPSSIASLSTSSATSLFSSRYGLFHIDIGQPSPLLYSLSHCASGAMIAGIVDRATSITLHEAIAARASGTKTPPPTSITLSHIETAITQIHTELLSVDHTDDIKALALTHNAHVKSVTRIIPDWRTSAAFGS